LTTAFRISGFLAVPVAANGAWNIPEDSVGWEAGRLGCPVDRRSVAELPHIGIIELARAFA